MAISNLSFPPPASNSISPVSSSVAAPETRNSADKQTSATVTLSTQGQQLNQGPSNLPPNSQTQTSDTANAAATSNVTPQSLGTAAAPGIQFMAGESKGGLVDTYA